MEEKHKIIDEGLPENLFSAAQARKKKRVVKNRKTSKENSVEVSVKKPVESTAENRLIELYRHKERER